MIPSALPVPEAPPIEVAEAIYAAVRDRNWTRFLALVDPAAADEFKREQRGFAVMALHFAQMPPENPGLDVPGAGTKGIAAPPLLRHVFRVESLDEFDALTAAEVVGRFMQVKHRAPREPTTSSSEEQSLLGVVHESADLAHVIVRTTVHVDHEITNEAMPFGMFPDSFRSWVDVLTLRRTSAGWRGRLNGGLITSGGGGFSIGWDRNDEREP